MSINAANPGIRSDRAHSSADVGPAQGKLGNDTIRESAAKRFASAVSDIAKSVVNFFKGLGGPSEAVKIANAQANVTRGAGDVIHSLRHGGLTQNDLGTIDSMMKNAVRANPDDPKSVVHDAIKEQLSDMLHHEQTMVLGFPFGEFSKDMRAQLHDNTASAVQLMDILDTTGVSTGAGNRMHADVTAMQDRIKDFVSVMRQVRDEVKNG